MSVQKTESKPKHRGYLEFGPLLLFFATNYFTKDIMLATAVLVASTLVALGLSWTLDRRVPKLALFGVFGKKTIPLWEVVCFWGVLSQNHALLGG